MIQHNKPTLGVEEEEAALKVIRSGWLAQGPEVEAFENEFCSFIGLPRGHAVAVSSGTAALFLAIREISSGNRNVIFPGFVCSSVRHAVAMAGLKENLLDMEYDLQKNSRIGDKDVMIIPHMFGIPVDIRKIKSDNIIEDCAQALGAKINGKSVGLHGKIGIFSFYVTKLMTTGGQGGMVVSTDKDIIDRIRDYRQFDYRDDRRKRFNFQMTDLQAAIGREQLLKLPKFLKRREEIFQKYKKSGLEFVDIDSKNGEFLEPVRYRAIVKTENPQRLIKSLEEVGVKAIIPLESWELLDDKLLFPRALEFTQSTVSLPIYPSLSEIEVERILSVLYNFKN